MKKAYIVMCMLLFVATIIPTTDAVTAYNVYGGTGMTKEITNKTSALLFINATGRLVLGTDNKLYYRDLNTGVWSVGYQITGSNMFLDAVTDGIYIYVVLINYTFDGYASDGVTEDYTINYVKIIQFDGQFNVIKTITINIIFDTQTRYWLQNSARLFFGENGLLYVALNSDIVTTGSKDTKIYRVNVAYATYTLVVDRAGSIFKDAVYYNGLYFVLYDTSTIVRYNSDWTEIAVRDITRVVNTAEFFALTVKNDFVYAVGRGQNSDGLDGGIIAIYPLDLSGLYYYRWYNGTSIFREIYFLRTIPIVLDAHRAIILDENFNIYSSVWTGSSAYYITDETNTTTFYNSYAGAARLAVYTNATSTTLAYAGHYNYYYNTFVTVSYNPPLYNPSVPSAPTLSATCGDGFVDLSWKNTATTTILEYRIYRGTVSGGETLIATVGNGTFSYHDINVTNGVSYYYYVTAVGLAGESLPSNEINATPHVASTIIPPTAPYSLTAKTGNGYILLTWSPPIGDGGTSVSYRIYRSVDKANFSLIAITTNTYYNDTAVSNGITYYYYVTAYNAAGESPPSNTIGVKTSDGVVYDSAGGLGFYEYSDYGNITYILIGIAVVIAVVALYATWKEEVSK